MFKNLNIIYINMFTLGQGYDILVKDRGDFEMSNFEIVPIGFIQGL
jgi:hypothetical protein